MAISATFKKSGSPGICIEGRSAVWTVVKPIEFGCRWIASLVISLFPRCAWDWHGGSVGYVGFFDFVP